MWDATGDIGLVSEMLFVRGFKCVGEDKQANSLEENYCCDERLVAWFGFELFTLNKVLLVFINHGRGYSVEV